MFTIGEFSRVTGLTVKALRLYHEEGVLVPASVDPRTGYRHYDAAQVETARVIAYLRGVELPLAEIRELLRSRGDDEQLLDALERHRAAVEERVRRLRRAARALDRFITDERQAIAMARDTYELKEKVLEPVTVAGIRMTGPYGDCGKGFARLGRAFGRHLRGKPLLLHYDAEYKEADADFEACFPVRPGAKPAEGVSVRELPGGRFVTLVHRGPYDQLGHSYARMLGYVSERGYRVAMPTREVYLKGPGMIFKGNPKNYLTEIQIPVEADGANVKSA